MTCLERDLLNHHLNDAAIAIGNGDDPLGFENSVSTFFRRTIHIDYLTNDGAIVAALNSSHNRMRVTSTVNWVTGSQESHVELTTHLTDYLGRENLSD